MFVCLHGAGKSRVAAALFNAIAPPGWIATSAGVEPQAQASEHAAWLLDGEPAAKLLDRTTPRAACDIDAQLVVAIDCETPTGRRWDLAHEWPEPQVRDQLRTLTADLVAELSQASHETGERR